MRELDEMAMQMRPEDCEEISESFESLMEKLDTKNKERDALVKQHKKVVWNCTAVEHKGGQLQILMIQELNQIFGNLGVLLDVNDIRAASCVTCRFL
jgi:hypothetical protein